MREYLRMASDTAGPTPMAHGMDSYQKMAGEDLEARVRQFLPLVQRIVARVAPFATPVDRDDLESYGAIGLYRALESFEPARGVPLEAYVAQRVRWAVVDGLRQIVPRDIPVPTHGEETSEEALESLSQRTLMSLHDGLGLSAEDTPEDSALREELRQELALGVERLPEKERLVMALLYVEDLTMKEAAEVLALSASHVSRLHGRAILRLRGMFSRRRNELLE